MNPLETEILKYEKKGFKKEQKKTMKYGTRIYLLKKGGLFESDEGVFIYYVDGDAADDSMREYFKDLVKFYEDKDFDCQKSFFIASGSLDEKLFRDLRQVNIKKEQNRNRIKAIALEKATEKETKKVSVKKEEDEKPLRKERDIETPNLAEIIGKIKRFSPIRMPKKEMELEDMLFSYLQHSYSIHPQQTYERATIDGRIGNIGIEIKFQPSSSEFDRLYGQVEKYLKYLDEIIVVIGYEKGRENTDYFEKRIKERGWLNSKVHVISIK